MKNCKSRIVFLFALCFFLIVISFFVDYKHSEILGARITYEYETTSFEYKGYDYFKLPNNYQLANGCSKKKLTLLNRGSVLISLINKAWIYSPINDSQCFYLECNYNDLNFEGGVFYREDIKMPTLTKENVESVDFYLYEDDTLIMSVKDKDLIEKILDCENIDDLDFLPDISISTNEEVEYCAVFTDELCYWF